MKLKYNKKILFSITFILILSASIFSQDIADNNKVLLPPAKDLIAVHHPDLNGVEKEVREQIVSFQDSLAEVAKTSPITIQKLSDAYSTMGQIYHAYSFTESAEECYTNASRLTPKDFRWVYLLGKVAGEQNKTYKAIDYYKKALELNPDYLPIHINLGNAYLELDLLGIAKESFENALKLNSNDPAALYGLGQVMYAQRNYKDAAVYFEKVLSLVPDANRVHYSLALAFRGLKEVEKAKFHLSKQGTVGVRVADPLVDGLNDLKQGVRLRLLRGKLAIESGRYAEAEAEFQKALAVEPESVPALVNYSVVLVNLGKYPEAIANFEKVLGLEPKNLNALYNLAVLFSLQEKHFQAIAHLKTILNIDPKDVPARFLLAKELRRAKLLQESYSEYVKVFNDNPDNEEILLEMVRVLSAKRDYQQAKDILEKSHANFPTRGLTAAAYAYLLATSPQTDLRDGTKALELAQKIYSATGAPEHGAIVALAYAELGRCEDAAKLTQELIEKTTDKDLIEKLKTELQHFQNDKPCNVKN
jgi:tetratricopeptide (TPR) repeat protein